MAEVTTIDGVGDRQTYLMVLRVTASAGSSDACLNSIHLKRFSLYGKDKAQTIHILMTIIDDYLRTRGHVQPLYNYAHEKIIK